MNNRHKERTGPRWGYAGPWYDEITPLKGSDPIAQKVAFTRRHELGLVSLGLHELRARPEAELERLADDLATDGLAIAPHFGFRTLAISPAEADREAAAVGEFLRRHARLFSGTIVKTYAQAGHRFDKAAPWPEKRQRMARALRPLAAACWDAGLPLGIENHGDYYCRDLVELCERVPRLYIFLDTGNPALIGEDPELAHEVAARWTVGTHFKDHVLRPRLDTNPLQFEIHGSALGEGDIPLRECYALLRERAPFPERLVMEVEMISPPHLDPAECLRRSLAFVRSLEEGA